MATTHTGCASRFFDKAGCAIKRRFKKLAFKTASKFRAVLEISKGSTEGSRAKTPIYLSEFSAITADETPPLPAQLVVAEPFDSAFILNHIDQLVEQTQPTLSSPECELELADDSDASTSCYEGCVEKAKSILSSLVCEPDLQDGDFISSACYKVAIDDRSEFLLHLEKTHYCIDLNSGMRFHFEDPHRQRVELVDWLSDLASVNGYNRKTLHLALVYLDLFLTDCGRSFKPNRIRMYGFVCLFLASMVKEQKQVANMRIHVSFGAIFNTKSFESAKAHVMRTLSWCLKLFEEGDNLYVRQVVDLPTVYDFLELAFQCAAMALPERFADQHALDNPDAQSPDGLSPFEIPRLYAALPFVNACDIADALLHDQDSQRIPGSQLAAACFYITAGHEGIDGSIVEMCTGYTVSAIMPAVFYTRGLLHQIYGDAGLDMEPRHCCTEETRFYEGLGEIAPGQRWLSQPYHHHMAEDFKNAGMAEL
ncbi:G1/S-specific cyclin-E1 [Coemansia sp. RSA 1722]|nr:G1/S-specific cyclin-E1 [Coemansia sp. RSA 1722]